MEEKYVVIQKPTCQEHEGRYFTLGFFDTRAQCECFIEGYCSDGYTATEELIIAVPIIPWNKSRK